MSAPWERIPMTPEERARAVCCACGTEKPLASFHPDRRRPLGVRSRCKDCQNAANRNYESTPKSKERKESHRKANAEAHREHNRSYRKRNPGAATRDSRRFRKTKPEAAKAHRILWQEIRAGRLAKMPCEVCGAGRSQAHHHDYTKPLEVRWLCQAHHSAEHTAIRARSEVK